MAATKPKESASLYAPRYWATWIALGLFRLTEPLPYSFLMFAGRWIGRLVSAFPSSFKHVAQRNFELSFPELSFKERERLRRRHFENLGMGLFETAIGWWSSDARIKRLTRLEGLEHLTSALAEGHGALLLSGHFGPPDIAVRALTVLNAVSVNIMYRPTRNRVLERFLKRNRAFHTKRAIPRDDIRTLVSALKANEAVWYAPDQSYRKKGAEMVPFFGIPVATNTATSRLARMTKARVLPYFPERLPRGGYLVRIHPALEDFPTDDPVADAARFNELIEAHARHVPEQYLWIHRRFKGLGKGAVDRYKR